MHHTTTLEKKCGRADHESHDLFGAAGQDATAFVHDKDDGTTVTTIPTVPIGATSASSDVVVTAGEVTIVKLGAIFAPSQQNGTIPASSPETRLYTQPWDEGQPIKHHTVCI
jgi:hypothetical protein